MPKTPAGERDPRPEVFSRASHSGARPSDSGLSQEVASDAEGGESFGWKEVDVASGAAGDEVIAPAAPRQDAVLWIRLDTLDATPQSWHLRRDLATADTDDIHDAVRVTEMVEPIRVVRDGTRFLIVSGLRRYYSAIRRRDAGGPERIPAILMAGEDPAALLRWNLLDALTRRAPSYLEVGWGLERLSRRLEEMSTATVTQAELMRHLGLEPKVWKGRISEYLATAEAIPEAAAECAAAAHACRLADLGGQPRSTLRHIRKADPQVRPVLLDVLAESVAKGDATGTLLRDVSASLRNVDVLSRAAAAVAEGRPASAVLPSARPEASNTVWKVTRLSVRRAIRATTRWCERLWRRVLLGVSKLTRGIVDARSALR